MNAIRDMYCTICGAETQDSVCGHVEQMPCDRCRCVTEHRDTCRCRGGHFHFNDFGTVPLHEMARFERAGCCYGGADGPNYSDKVTDKHGVVYEDKPQFSADGRAEKAARAEHKRNKRHGRGRIYGPTSGLKESN